MKKIISILVAIIMVFSLVACGGKTTSNVNQETSTTQNTEVVEQAPAQEKAEPQKTDTSSSTPEWKQFLQDYEKWVDKYISIMEKYSKDPSDFSILADYTSMMTELVEWTEKTEQMQKELEKASPAEVTKYCAELARIALKMAEISY